MAVVHLCLRIFFIWMLGSLSILFWSMYYKMQSECAWCLLSCIVILWILKECIECCLTGITELSFSLTLHCYSYSDLLYKIILFLADEWCYGIWIAMGVFCQSRHLWVIFRTKSCSWCIERVSIHLFHHEGRVLNSVAMNTQVILYRWGFSWDDIF